MNKKALIDAIAQRRNCTKVEALEFLDTFLSILMEQVNFADEFQLHGVGSFKAKVRSARTGRNPRTGEPMEIKARRVIQFKASPSLLSLLNNNSN